MEPLSRDPSPRAPAAVRIRTFRWADLDSVFRLDCAARGRRPDVTGGGVRAFEAALRLPRADPERNLLLAVSDGVVGGYVRVELELNIGRAVAWLRVPPGKTDREAARALLEAATERARLAGASVLHVPVEHPAEAARVDVLRAGGMRVVRRRWRMRRPAVPVDVPPVPEGMRVRPFKPGADEATLADLQTAVFAGTWGYSPNTVEDAAARLALPGHGRDCVLFIEEGGRAIAYCWSARVEEDGEAVGLIHMMGVRAERRGRGLGRLVASLGVRLLLEAGVGTVELRVDRANNAAVRVYRELGFRRASDVIWYGRRLGIERPAGPRSPVLGTRCDARP